MSLQSDINVDASRFAPSSITQKTKALNENILKALDGAPKWWEIGAHAYRRLRKEGGTAFPKPVVLDTAKTLQLPSRDAGRTIPLRVVRPKDGSAIKGVYAHIHGGGFVLGDEEAQDVPLQWMADATSLTVVSIGYRLAPENPYPAGPEGLLRCGRLSSEERQSGIWRGSYVHRRRGTGTRIVQFRTLVNNFQLAGAHLTTVSTLHLLESQPNFSLRGVILHYGTYEMASFFPSVHLFNRAHILDKPRIDQFLIAFLGEKSEAERRDPRISPFYADFSGLRLPPALFTCGTEDPLLDDTVFMSTKRAAAGAEAVVKIYPGAPHGFTMFEAASCEPTADALQIVEKFLVEKSK
ncbi:alpha/beta hydrolase fold-domain-containing protein [Lineolata rhizophorae]|uniref:Alpha/beta hydrolase fold-domain-containing protein n=1 Tax=Lineolata rhizophorae TaxID=578093 RepID=A0A6A6NKV0_9PEZI|nr:alpha/beta hydrolase fold-domain-containing protein [Lineolata rhizophorae]